MSVANVMPFLPLYKKRNIMKKTRKSSAKTITARIPVEFICQILDDPENISLCHALVSAILEADRIARPDGIASELDSSPLHPSSSSEADTMAEDARRRAEQAAERREARKMRAEQRIKMLERILCDNKSVALSSIFGTGLFTPVQERAIDALLNPTVRTINKLSPDQLRAFFLPFIMKFNKLSAADVPAALRRHAVTA